MLTLDTNPRDPGGIVYPTNDATYLYGVQSELRCRVDIKKG